VDYHHSQDSRPVMPKYLISLARLAFFLPPLLLASPQLRQTPSSENAQNHDLQNDSGITLRVTTREVLVDLIALDPHNQAVLDLAPAELQVSESAEPETSKKRKRKANRSNGSPSIEPITSLSIIDPNRPPSSADDERTGFRILASCLERSTVHYLLAFHPGPDAWTSGHHKIAISTSRPGIKLFYRHEYYVGLVAPATDSPIRKKEKIDQLLRQSACYYPVTPLSIALQAHFIDTGRVDTLRYLVSVDASSLSFLTLKTDSAGRGTAGIDRRIELDYGTCNFDQSGHPVSYFHAPLEQVLTSADYARALDRGFPHILEFAASEHIAVTRVVVRDRATGNLGAADVAIQLSEQPPDSQGSPAAAQTDTDLKTYQDRLSLDWTRDGHKQPSVWIWPAKGPIGSFGSIVPAPHSFCGDVYELPHTFSLLPDFRELDPIGSIYTPSLDIPNQTFSNTSGIPGVTPRTNLFGIDYQGVFWVRSAGEYQFLMASDDGAILQIDDKKVIDLDGVHSVDAATGHIHLETGLHTIHVPYYQGAVDSVALELWVKPPSATDWILFNLSDYATPPSNTNSPASAKPDL
jgi:PA14 domain